MTRRNTLKSRGKILVEPFLGHRLTLTALADFDLCEPILLKASEKTKTISAFFNIRRGLNTSFIQPENSTRTILVSDNQFARLDMNGVKTESPVDETIPLHQDESSAAISTAEQPQPESSEPSRTSTRIRKEPGRFGDPFQHVFKRKGEDVRVSKKHH